MKQSIKRIICSICILALFVPLISSLTFAATPSPRSTVVSEYDYITLVRSMSPEELVSAPINSEEIELLLSDAPERELLKRKEKTDKELFQLYGYNSEEIALLRAYQGEAIDSNPSLASLTATLTISQVIAIFVTSSRVDMKIVWKWDHCPIFTAKDVFAVYWSPTFNGNNGNMRLNISKSSHIVTYTYGTASFTKTYSFTQVLPNSAAKVEFAMDHQSDAWASTGTATLYFEATTGSPALNEMDMVFAYGHTTVDFAPSVSFPIGGGISFGFATHEEASRSGYVSVERRVWVNN